MYDYEWDPDKARVNQLKLGISFADATFALEDVHGLTIEDDHPGEQRFITIGMDAFGRILVVVYTFQDLAIRIISARKATSGECKQYKEG